MNLMFYNTGAAISRASVDANCVIVDGGTVNFSPNGLNGCSAQLNCTRNIDAANTTSYYRIQSQATCGSGAVSAQRMVEVSAYMK